MRLHFPCHVSQGSPAKTWIKLIFANDFRNDQIDPLCLSINITFNVVSMRAVCCTDKADEAAITYFHFFGQTESLSCSLSGWMFTS